MKNISSIRFILLYIYISIKRVAPLNLKLPIHPHTMSEPPQPTILPNYLQDHEPTQECLEIISTLPREKGWVATHLHQYQGFWHTSRQLQGVLSCQKHFQAHDTDIFVVTTPKSGTTWLKALTFSLLNRNKYSSTQKNHPLLTNNPHSLVPFLELSHYQEEKLDLSPNPNNSLISSSSPRLLSTHLPYVSLPKSMIESNCKMVYLCRDPKDTFVSLWHFTNRLRPESRGINLLQESFDKFCRGVSLCGPFWDHVLGYWKKSLEEPEKVKFLKFEEIKMRPLFVLKELAGFLGCSFSQEEEDAGVPEEILELCSFEKLSNLEVNKEGKMSTGEEHRAFFRHGEVGDWKNHLTVEMIEQLNTITEKKLAGHGLRF